MSPSYPICERLPDVLRALRTDGGYHGSALPLYPYYISSKLAGQRVTLSIQATEQSLQVVYPQEYCRSLPLKGLHQRALPYREYLELMQREASTQQRLLAMGRWKGCSD